MGASTSVLEKALLEHQTSREESRRIAKVLEDNGIDSVEKAKRKFQYLKRPDQRLTVPVANI